MSTYNIERAARALIINAQKRIPCMMLGAPGIGKSQIVGLVATLLAPGDILPGQPMVSGVGLIDIRVSQKDAVDTRGLPVADLENGTTRWLVPSDLPNVARDGACGILFLDELTNAPMSVQAALYQLVLDRRLGDYILPDGWIVFAAGNRTSDKSAAQRLSKALADRFSIINVIADVDAWLRWAARKNLAASLRAFIAFRRELLSTIENGQEEFATPRSVAACDAYVRDTAIDDADLRMMIASQVGDDWAREFMAFRAMFQNVPSPQAIIANPLSADVPSEPSLLWAIATTLADMADASNFDAIMAYGKRFPMADYHQLLVSDATMRLPALKETPSYVAHAIAMGVN